MQGGRRLGTAMVVAALVVLIAAIVVATWVIQDRPVPAPPGIYDPLPEQVRDERVPERLTVLGIGAVVAFVLAWRGSRLR